VFSVIIFQFKCMSPIPVAGSGLILKHALREQKTKRTRDVFLYRRKNRII